MFLLTDGEVDNKEEVIDYVWSKNKIIKIHTFGIGSSCDRDLIENIA